MPKPYVVSFSNQKGGVGKTTSCISIASAAADMGLSVLLVDMDPQGNSTSGVGIQKKKISRSVYDVLLGECTAEEAVIKTEFKNLSLIPSTINLAGAEFEIIDMEQRENCLKNAIKNLDGYDLVVIDCPPSLSMLTVNALTASDGVVIPMQAEYYALEGLTQLMMTIRKVKELYNPSLAVLNTDNDVQRQVQPLAGGNCGDKEVLLGQADEDDDTALGEAVGGPGIRNAHRIPRQVFQSRGGIQGRCA